MRDWFRPHAVSTWFYRVFGASRKNSHYQMFTKESKYTGAGGGEGINEIHRNREKDLKRLEYNSEEKYRRRP